MLTLFEREIRVVLTWLSAHRHLMALAFFESFILLVEVRMVVVGLSIPVVICH